MSLLVGSMFFEGDKAFHSFLAFPNPPAVGKPRSANTRDWLLEKATFRPLIFQYPEMNEKWRMLLTPDFPTPSGFGNIKSAKQSHSDRVAPSGPIADKLCCKNKSGQWYAGQARKLALHAYQLLGGIEKLMFDWKNKPSQINITSCDVGQVFQLVHLRTWPRTMMRLSTLK